MRVLQVTPYYAPAWAYGGPPRVMTELAVGLAARGHKVTVLTTDVLDEEHRAEPRHEVLDGVSVTRYPNLSNSLAWRTKKYLPPGLLPGLLREAPRHDVIHVTDTRTFVTASSFLTSASRRTPLCLSAHGSLPASTGLRGAVKRAYDTVLVRPMLARSPLLLAQTAHEASLYERFGGRPDGDQAAAVAAAAARPRCRTVRTARSATCSGSARSRGSCSSWGGSTGSRASTS